MFTCSPTTKRLVSLFRPEVTKTHRQDVFGWKCRWNFVREFEVILPARQIHQKIKQLIYGVPLLPPTWPKIDCSTYFARVTQPGHQGLSLAVFPLDLFHGHSSKRGRMRKNGCWCHTRQYPDLSSDGSLADLPWGSLCPLTLFLWKRQLHLAKMRPKCQHLSPSQRFVFSLWLGDKKKQNIARTVKSLISDDVTSVRYINPWTVPQPVAHTLAGHDYNRFCLGR